MSHPFITRLDFYRLRISYLWLYWKTHIVFRSKHENKVYSLSQKATRCSAVLESTMQNLVKKNRSPIHPQGWINQCTLSYPLSYYPSIYISLSQKVFSFQRFDYFFFSCVSHPLDMLHSPSPYFVFWFDPFNIIWWIAWTMDQFSLLNFLRFLSVPIKFNL